MELLYKTRFSAHLLNPKIIQKSTQTKHKHPIFTHKNQKYIKPTKSTINTNKQPPKPKLTHFFEKNIL